MSTDTTKPQQKYKKANIPKALREQVWLKYIGSKFESKCLIPWCENRMTTFDFHVAHNVPESSGGKLDITNLRPLCSRCNLSMGNKYTISQWAKIGAPSTSIPELRAALSVSAVSPPKHTWCCGC
jgi:5-methylcytosine-specific restriction endonuclease McrA